MLEGQSDLKFFSAHNEANLISKKAMRTIEIKATNQSLRTVVMLVNN